MTYPEKVAEDLRKQMRQFGITENLINEYIPKKGEEMIENKMVSVELPECYIRTIGENYVNDRMASYMEPPISFFRKCREWVEANPPPPKMRPMTINERMNWAFRNLGAILNLSKIKLGDFQKHTRVLDCTINEILNAETWQDKNGINHKFEVPE